MTAMAEVAVAPAAAPAGTGGGTVLSERVARALQLRTDAPALRAALDALGQMAAKEEEDAEAASSSLASLPRADGGGRAGGGGMGGLRDGGVRAAIERDALAQAEGLRDRVNEVLRQVRDLRADLGRAADCARSVRDAAHRSATGAGFGGGSVGPPQNVPNASATPDHDSSGGNSGDAEAVLAAQLARAFDARDKARRRHRAVRDFLEAYDLTPHESELLDRYRFDDATTALLDLLHQHSGGGAGGSAGGSAPGGGPHPDLHSGGLAQGWDFLRALDRAARVRRALASGGGKGGGLRKRQAPHPHVPGAAALRLLDALGTRQEKAHERLYRWLQWCLAGGERPDGEDRTLPDNGEEDDPDAPDPLELALTLGGDGRGGVEVDGDDGNAGIAREPDRFVPAALSALRRVPAFRAHLLEAVAARRRRRVTRHFLVGLARGPPALRSHDPAAHAAELLAAAWRALCGEAELARGILLLSDDTGGSKRAEEPDGDPSDAAPDDERTPPDDGNDDGLTGAPLTALDLVAAACGGLARPLKGRVSQVVASLARQARPRGALAGTEGDGDHDDASDDDDDDGLLLDLEDEGAVQRHRIAHLYEICGLLLFYAGAVDKELRKLAQQQLQQTAGGGGDDGLVDAARQPLLATLQECLLEAARGYEATTRAYAARLEALAAVAGEPPAALVRALLEPLGNVRRTSPGFSSGVPGPADDDCRRALSLEWAASALVDAALAARPTLDDVVVLKQAVAATKKAGLDVVAAERLDEALDAREASLIEQVVESESAAVLERCGLGSLVADLRRWQDASDTAGPLASFPGLSTEELEAGLRDFYASLYAPPLPSLEGTIRDPLLRKTARARIAVRVCDSYRDLYRAATAPGAGYSDASSFLGHTPEQVRTLFSA